MEAFRAALFDSKWVDVTESLGQFWGGRPGQRVRVLWLVMASRGRVTLAACVAAVYGVGLQTHLGQAFCGRFAGRFESETGAFVEPIRHPNSCVGSERDSELSRHLVSRLWRQAHLVYAQLRGPFFVELQSDRGILCSQTISHPHGFLAGSALSMDLTSPHGATSPHCSLCVHY